MQKSPMVPDANSPKLPLNGYFVFMTQRRKEIGSAMSSKYHSVRDFTSAVGAEWRQLSPEVRAAYVSKSQQEKENYAKLGIKYQKPQKIKKFRQKLTMGSHKNASTAVVASIVKKRGRQPKKMLNDDLDISPTFIDETLGTDIPIFTEQFLEHNKQRESKVRKLRNEITHFENEEKAARQNLSRLKIACEQYDAELKKLEIHKKNFDQKYDEYSTILQLAFEHLPLPGFPNGANSNNLTEYLEKLHDLIMKATNENQPLLVRCRDIAKRIKLI